MSERLQTSVRLYGSWIHNGTLYGPGQTILPDDDMLAQDILMQDAEYARKRILEAQEVTNILPLGHPLRDIIEDQVGVAKREAMPVRTPSRMATARLNREQMPDTISDNRGSAPAVSPLLRGNTSDEGDADGDVEEEIADLDNLEAKFSVNAE